MSSSTIVTVRTRRPHPLRRTRLPRLNAGLPRLARVATLPVSLAVWASMTSLWLSTPRLPAAAGDRGWRQRPGRCDRGQATAEYALVLLGAAAIAVVLIGWATSSGKVTELLDGVVDKLMSNL
ncbi:MAG: DUF4244 domain-containing protein [Acidimicrobiia bacterium]